MLKNAICPVAFVSAIIFFSNDLYAQKSKLEIGLNGGAYVYQGDLTSNRFGSFKTLSSGFGISVAKPISDALSARFVFNFSKLKGDDTKYGPEYRQYRAFKFTNGIKEFSLQAQYKFLSGREPKFQPYVFAGAGISFMKLSRDISGYQASYFGDAENLTSRIAEDMAVTPKRILVVPVGVGVQYALSNSFSLNSEINYRLTRSDYIDGFSVAGNPKLKDHYSSATVGIVYHLGKRAKGIGCPKNVY